MTGRPRQQAGVEGGTMTLFASLRVLATFALATLIANAVAAAEIGQIKVSRGQVAGRAQG
jgi:hypothetical protein